MSMRELAIGVVGATGLVGQELLELFKKRTPFTVDKLSARDFVLDKDYDFLFLATPSSISKEIASLAKEKTGCIIDLSSAHRNDPLVPLIIPEINGYLLEKNPPLIASPNCIATILLLPLAPLHRLYTIKKIIASSYQAASGAGALGLKELLQNEPPSIFPHPYAYNVFLHESPRSKDNFCEEEEKVLFETRKILEEPRLPINIRCVRVPVERAHSLSINVIFERPPKEAAQILEESSGLLYHTSPTPRYAEKRDEVLWGSLRQDPTEPCGLDIWVCGDQLLKGAALNAFQIFEALTSQIKTCL
jgi:aspartate-semialdehyde dehydrogenase